jgi:hypothetical protein
VARRKWHVDIGFAAKDLEPSLRSLAADFPGAQFLFFGFGDRHYLLANNRHFASMLAAVWPGPGIILATGLKATPGEAFGAAGSHCAQPWPKPFRSKPSCGGRS